MILIIIMMMNDERKKNQNYLLYLLEILREVLGLSNEPKGSYMRVPLLSQMFGMSRRNLDTVTQRLLNGTHDSSFVSAGHVVTFKSVLNYS